MKYVNEVSIHLPREQVIALMGDQENMKHWMPGLLKYELIEGEAGQVGAKTELEFQMGKRNMKMLEYIIKNESPQFFDAEYTTKGVYNEQKNEFISVSANETKWISYSYFKFSGFMKLIALLFPASFRKQSQQYLDNFKAFVEEGKSVLEKS